MAFKDLNEVISALTGKPWDGMFMCSWCGEKYPDGGLSSHGHGCEKQKTGDAAFAAMTKHVATETSTAVCRCGESFTWGGLNDDLNPWILKHASHMCEDGKA